MRKFLPSDVQPKSVLSLKSESKLNKIEIDSLSSLRDTNNFPLISKTDLETLNLTPENATVEVEVRTMFSTDKKSFTVRELGEFAKNNEIDSMKINKINYNRSFSKKELAISNSKMTENSLERISEMPEDKLSYVVEYQSGELGSYSGNSTMIRELSLRDDVKSVNQTFSTF